MQANLVIIGNGRIAQQLIKAFSKEKISTCFIFGRDEEKLNNLISEFAFLKKISLDEIQDNSICLLCVSDSAISKVAQSIPNANCTLIHFSGVESIDLIIESHKNAGVFWPIKSFAFEKETSWEDAPVAAEVSSPKSEEDLMYLNSLLRARLFFLDENKRTQLHLAAVTVNNFSNHLFHLAYSWCEKNDLPFESLIPIIQQTAQRINHQDPAVFQTGPAIRGDEESLSKHYELLQNDSQFLAVYKLLSDSIKNSK